MKYIFALICGGLVLAELYAPAVIAGFAALDSILQSHYKNYV